MPSTSVLHWLCAYVALVICQNAWANSEKRPLDLSVEPLAAPTPDFTERLGFRGDGLGTALPEAQAFVYEAIADGPNTVLVRFVIAPGYYLYRDQLGFEARYDGQPITVAHRLPTAERFNDPHFGWSSIYRNEVLITVELQTRPPPAGELRLLARFQGCKQDGICYPPMERELALALVAFAPPTDAVPTKPESTAWPLWWLALGLMVGACAGIGRLGLRWRAQVGLAIGLVGLLVATGALAAANVGRATSISAFGLLLVAVLLRVAGTAAQPALAALGLACLASLAAAPSLALVLAVGALIGSVLEHAWSMAKSGAAASLTLLLGLAGIVACASALPAWLTLLVGGAWLIDGGLRLGALTHGTATALRSVAVLALLLGQLALIGAATGARDWRFPLAPPMAEVARPAAPATADRSPPAPAPSTRTVVRDSDALDRALEQAHGQRALIIHGSARWCASCDSHRQALAKALPPTLEVGWVEIDLSANDSASRLLLSRLRESGPPFYVVYDHRGRRLELRLDPTASAEELAARLGPALAQHRQLPDM